MKNQLETKIIAEYTITLFSGRRYLASRPIANRERAYYPVTIKALPDINGDDNITIEFLTYAEANRIVNAFNNGPASWMGRIW